MKKLLVAVVLFFVGSYATFANEYPTYETVHFVLSCMDELGGQTEENAYTCSCRYDSIRATMPFSEYEEGRTFERNKKMPGEKGAFFRDNQRGEGFYKTLVKAREIANSSCITVKHVELIRPTS